MSIVIASVWPIRSGRALGREVSVSNIELKLLPRPGLVLSNFVVAEDSSYGAEPMLRACHGYGLHSSDLSLAGAAGDRDPRSR